MSDIVGTDEGWDAVQKHLDNPTPPSDTVTLVARTLWGLQDGIPFTDWTHLHHIDKAPWFSKAQTVLDAIASMPASNKLTQDQLQSAYDASDYCGIVEVNPDDFKPSDAVERLEAQCARAEYEFPLLAAPDGTVAVRFTDLRAALSAIASMPDTSRQAGEAWSVMQHDGVGASEDYTNGWNNALYELRTRLTDTSRQVTPEMVGAARATSCSASIMIKSELAAIHHAMLATQTKKD